MSTPSSRERRNPYLLLGVAPDATRDEIEVAFARRRKKLVQEPDSPVSVEDLGWALDWLQQATLDPNLRGSVYQVPADPSAYEVPKRPGLLLPPPRPLARRTPPVPVATRQHAGLAAARRLLRQAFLEEAPGHRVPRPYEIEEIHD